MGQYRDLKAWQVAHDLALEVSNVVDAFPQHERFELTSQLRRASLSVPTNLAEGQGRFGPREALRFTRIAAGSLVEVDYLLFFAKEKGYLDPQSHDRLVEQRKHASRLINGLARSLQSAIPKRPSRLLKFDFGAVVFASKEGLLLIPCSAPSPVRRIVKRFEPFSAH